MEVQVKTWSTPKERDGFWRYDRLNENRFNLLTGKRRVPRYLFLLIVPPDAERYAVATEDSLTLTRAAYWVSLADEPKILNPSSSSYVQVSVPKSNLLTVESLLKLFDPLRLVEAP